MIGREIAGLSDRHVLEVLRQRAERHGLAHAAIVGPDQLRIGLTVDAFEHGCHLPDDVSRFGLAEALADIDRGLSSSHQHGKTVLRPRPPGANPQTNAPYLPLRTAIREREGERAGEGAAAPTCKRAEFTLFSGALERSFGA